MMNKTTQQLTGFVLFFLILLISPIGDSVFGKEAVKLPENLALGATAVASSEYSGQYRAAFAVSGAIPDVRSTGADLNRCWCVNNEQANDRAEFSLSWNEPIEVSQIVYWGRTSWFLSECWRHYELYLNDQTVPVAKGEFLMVHGPQAVDIPKQKIDRLRFVFLDSWGGPNPGAAEIMVFGDTLSPDQWKKLSQNKTLPFIGELEPQDGDFLTQGLKRFLVIKRFEIESSHVYTYHYEGFRPGGGLYLFDVEKLKTNPHDAGESILQTPTGQILDADLSHDGKTILFSWRCNVDEPYHLWTIDVTGENLTQRTSGPWHDYNACWLPEGDIAFLSTRSPQFAYCWNAPVGILHRMKLDGSRLIRLSSNYLNDFTPTILDDGRIIYGRWEYVDRPAIPIQSLWTIHPDGTSLQVYYGNRVLSPATFMEARSIPGTSHIVCTMTGHNGPTRGAIGVIRREHGVNAQESIENVTPEITIDPVDRGDGNYWPKQVYSTPWPLDENRYLVSARGPVQVRTYETDQSGQPVVGATLLAAPDDGMQYLMPIPLEPRPIPPTIGSDVLDKLDENDKWQGAEYATIFLQDVYRGVEDVAPGEIASIRIVREMPKTVRIEPDLRSFGFQFPTISCGATYAGKMILGDVPVAPDGSAFFKVGVGATADWKTIDRPTGEWRVESGEWNEGSGKDSMFPCLVPTTGAIYFLALDSEGRAVDRMRSFTHLMPGESLSCIGCHEAREESPQASELRSMLKQEPVSPVVPEWADQSKMEPQRAAISPGFDYVQTVQPIWDSYCVSCHNPYDNEGGIDLTGDFTDYFNVSYDTLVSEKQGAFGSPYVSWIPTYNGQEQNILIIGTKKWGSYQSKLAELVRSGHPDSQGNSRFDMDDESRRKVFAWIDLNIPYYGSSETSHLELPGCRRIYPPQLDTVLNEVGSRRCAECHQDGNMFRREWIMRTQNQFNYPGEDSPGIVPRRTWTRVTQPHRNDFLLAPLAKEAGGTQRCSKVVFADTNDPDYQTILETFRKLTQSLEKQPRIDMPNGRIEPDSCRLTQ